MRYTPWLMGYARAHHVPRPVDPVEAELADALHEALQDAVDGERAARRLRHPVLATAPLEPVHPRQGAYETEERTRAG